MEEQNSEQSRQPDAEARGDEATPAPENGADMIPADETDREESPIAESPSPKSAIAESPSPKSPSPGFPVPGFPVVALGASAGGLDAFSTFFEHMPPDAGMAFVVVAHLDRTHVSVLPDLLQKHTRMLVRQARNGVPLRPNTVYVIPPNKEMTLFDGILRLEDAPDHARVNLPIDTLFRSLAADRGPAAVAVVLSGTGSDGTLGLKAIKEEFGMVMVQDEESAQYDGMPRSAAATGLADYVVSPDKMPELLIDYVRRASLRVGLAAIPSEGPPPTALQKIYVLLRARTDHDFSLYKRNTICRRIERRMNVHRIETMDDYARFLRESGREVGILFKELLIGVTNFFREPDAFKTLRDDILIKILEKKPEDYTVRIWVPGCSTGEEAYSLAILVREAMETLRRRFGVQIFGTDIDEQAIEAARIGLFPETIVADVEPERLARHFVKEEDGRYRIAKSIRETLVFAPQNVIKDPPFTKLDLLSCRNLLIYLSPELQQRLLQVFHYSLREDGVLFLGSSESVGQATDLFTAVDKKWRIFRRRPADIAAVSALDLRPLPGSLERARAPDTEPRDTGKTEELSALQLVETILRQTDAPPCVIIDEGCNIVYIHGRTGRFLEPAEGKAGVNILEMARPGFKTELSAAVRKAALHQEEVTHRGLRVAFDGGHLFLNLTVKPIQEQPALQGLMMVVFEETTDRTEPSVEAPPAPSEPENEKTADELRRELRFVKEDLQTTIEELQTSNEELKSSNEELQSTNEELQSTNEELETAKEELQSLNEEASTVNAELQSRVDELSKAHDDMKNLLDSTDVATLFLDSDFRVRRFTPRLKEFVPLSGTDVGRPISHFASTLVDVDLSQRATDILDDLVPRESEVVTADGRVWIMKIRPYRTTNNVIDGVVVTFSDISNKKREENAYRETSGRFESLVDDAPDAIYLVVAGRFAYINRAALKLLGAASSDELLEKTGPRRDFPQRTAKEWRPASRPCTRPADRLR